MRRPSTKATTATGNVRVCVPKRRRNGVQKSRLRSRGDPLDDLRPSADAVQSHYLNLIDQYSYFDRSITPYNFLKFSEERWKLYNSPITWLNRMRIADYRELFGSLGFDITKEVNSSGAAADLHKIRLAPEFQKYSEADLLVLTSWLTAKSAGT